MTEAGRRGRRPLQCLCDAMTSLPLTQKNSHSYEWEFGIFTYL